MVAFLFRVERDAEARRLSLPPLAALPKVPALSIAVSHNSTSLRSMALPQPAAPPQGHMRFTPGAPVPAAPLKPGPLPALPPGVT